MSKLEAKAQAFVDHLGRNLRVLIPSDISKPQTRDEFENLLRSVIQSQVSHERLQQHLLTKFSQYSDLLWARFMRLRMILYGFHI